MLIAAYYAKVFNARVVGYILVAYMRNRYKKQKLIVVLILFLLSIFYTRENNVFASPPAPAPRCHVEGVNQKVTYNKASNDTQSGGPTDMATDMPERYSLEVFINKTTYVDGE